MRVDLFPQPERWEAFLGGFSPAPYLQSWAWGEFQTQVGRAAQRLLICADDGQPVAAAQVLTHRYPLGFRSLYLPQAPVFRDGFHDDPAVWQALIGALGESGQAARALFIRFEPQQSLDLGNRLPVRRVASVQPSVTHLLDLTKGEEALLNSMHSKTRYNIRLAERQGVTVEAGGAELLEDFLALLSQTEARHGVRFFGPAYFRALWATQAARPHLRFFRARHHDQTLASILLYTFGDTAVYLHGGSTREGRQHMGPHLAQWTAIRESQQRGLHWYDFRGVAPADAPATHPWAGFSRFKRGFGGVDVAYPGAYDWVRRPLLYRLYRAAQRVR